MPSEIRLLTKEEMSQAGYIWSQAFGFGKRRADTEEENRPDATYGNTFAVGAFDEAGLQAVLEIFDYRIYLGAECVVPMGGVGGVACLPASRGKGYAGQLLRFALGRMHELGVLTSALFPFSWEYYRKYGWEWVGTFRDYKVSTSCIKSDPETEYVRAATVADREIVKEIYTTYAKRYRGCMVRNEGVWYFLNDTKEQYTFTYLYERDGLAEGYLIYRAGKEEETRLCEFIALTGRAQRALLGLLRRHEMQTKRFCWSAPLDDTMWSQYFHWDIETSLRNTPMGRVVDVAGAIRAWKPAREVQGSVVFSLQDTHAPWNTGTWEVEFGGGEAQVQPSQKTPQLAMDIQAFSQAYFGTPFLDAIRHAGRIDVADEAGYRAFADLLRGPLMWINDEF
jgi:predicted acetyltransferase